MRSVTSLRRTARSRSPIPSIATRRSNGRRCGRCATGNSGTCRPACSISSIGGTHTDSNGCAAGNTREEAIVQGFLELVERDAYAIWWYNRLQRPAVDLGAFDDAYIRDIQTQFTDFGRKIWVLDITSDLGVPTYVAMMHWMQDGKENMEFGSGSHFDRRIALLRSLTELSQFLTIGTMGGGGARGDQSTLDGVTPLRVEAYPFLLPAKIRFSRRRWA